jgi:murein tripeptide amidase MpaA
MSGYLTTEGLDAAVLHLPATYPSICHAVELPEKSVEGRVIRAVRIGKPGEKRKRGVFFLGGVHAREIVNPDLLVAFGLRLCRAATTGRGLSFGDKHFAADEVQRLVDELTIYLLPLANPDGRAFVQAPHGNPMWRKNRRPNPDSPHCLGVDINRNFDFLWPAGLTASSHPCSYQFKGPAAFSEPETRNVRHLVEAHPDIRLFVDLHSFSQTCFYPWGDNRDQTTDPEMSFENPTFDGKRGKPHHHDYREYIRPEDLELYRKTADRARDAIGAVRGTHYTVNQSVGLYPTSGTSDDYTYSRSYVGGRRVMGFTVETAREFQPKYAEAKHVITEVSAGLVAYCQAALDLPVTMGDPQRVPQTPPD